MNPSPGINLVFSIDFNLVYYINKICFFLNSRQKTETFGSPARHKYSKQRWKMATGSSSLANEVVRRFPQTGFYGPVSRNLIQIL